MEDAKVLLGKSTLVVWLMKSGSRSWRLEPERVLLKRWPVSARSEQLGGGEAKPLPLPAGHRCSAASVNCPRRKQDCNKVAQ